MLQSANLQPLVLGWLIAAIIRISLGSATVAGLTAAGISFVNGFTRSIYHPNLMVLAIGAGSLAFSHVNDGGFWLFKEYFNLSIKRYHQVMVGNGIYYIGYWAGWGVLLNHVV